MRGEAGTGWWSSIGVYEEAWACHAMTGHMMKAWDSESCVSVRYKQEAEGADQATQPGGRAKDTCIQLRILEVKCGHAYGEARL
jgi:hypothetical protein